MNVYFSRIPAAAVFSMFDGHKYAKIPHRMVNGKVVEDFKRPRMVRFADNSFIKNGEAYIQFAKTGDAVPEDNVHFGVSVINFPHSQSTNG